MSKIHVMSDNLANKIAAGEVVEKIASVVKELVENAIDAKSKKIIVDLIDSGTKSIKVIDDGIGMDKEDASLAFERHATSKLLKEDDLFFINTLGFRGEALPSIASVSKVTLTTSNGEAGTTIKIEDGYKILEENAPLRKGTTMQVDDLFYNTPARLKYLKSDATELANVTSYIERLALTSPEISFTLTNNGRKIVFTSGSGDLLKTIHEIFGYEISSNMIEVNKSNDDFDVYGYICKPQVLKSNRNHMITIVNNRIVKNMDINRAINDGYFKFKPDIKYPVVILKIDTDPTLIDVNIHPTKQDIKISKIEVLTRMLVDMINDALTKTLLVHEMSSSFIAPSIVDNTKNYETNEKELYVSESQLQMDYTKEQVQEEQLTFEEVKETVISRDITEKEKHEDLKRLELNPVGIALQTYIIAENQEGMYLIDQHAAHERVNYERTLKKMKEKDIYRKQMLFPITLEYSTSDAMKLQEHMDLIEELGFVVEEFGINTYAVKEHPDWLREGMEDMLTKHIFDMIIEDANKFDRMRFLDRVAATTACKMSVRAHEEISLDHAREILKDLMLCDNPYNCAHGRPTIIHYSNYELERMFKRVMN